MAIHRDVSGPGIVARGLNIAYCAPVQQVGNILRDIGPSFSSVPCNLDKAIVGARPNRACFLRRLRDSENPHGEKTRPARCSAHEPRFNRRFMINQAR
jgi:hypothetical protein